MARAHQRQRVTSGGHIYVHIPFCHRICPYCSFYKHQPGDADTAQFLKALTTELRTALAVHPAQHQPRTLYFGGGTPTLLSTVQLAAWLPEFLSLTGTSQLQEWTVEVNPRTINPNKAKLLRDHGVTRVSLGIQSWDPAVLHTLGRDHSPEQGVEAYQILRAAGFPVVNIDLMFSVPGQTLTSWQETLTKSIQLQPDHISAYNLTYEEDTAFFDSLQRGDYQKDEAADTSHFATAIEQLAAAGFRHYETSNYAQPGAESLHNQSYWAGEDYLGLGPSAVSTIHGQRWKNLEHTTLYTQLALEGQSAIHAPSCEEIDDSRWACERIALELRTARGVALHYLPDRTLIEPLLEEGLAEVHGERLVLTSSGKFLTDPIAAHLWV